MQQSLQCILQEDFAFYVVYALFPVFVNEEDMYTTILNLRSFMQTHMSIPLKQKVTNRFKLKSKTQHPHSIHRIRSIQHQYPQTMVVISINRSTKHLNPLMLITKTLINTRHLFIIQDSINNLHINNLINNNNIENNWYWYLIHFPFKHIQILKFNNILISIVIF